MTKDLDSLIKALRCSASPYPGGSACEGCEYRFLEEVPVDTKIPYKPDVEIDGKKYWESCDCDRIVSEAADVIEKLAKANKSCSKCTNEFLCYTEGVRNET